MNHNLQSRLAKLEGQQAPPRRHFIRAATEIDLAAEVAQRKSRGEITDQDEVVLIHRVIVKRGSQHVR